MLLRKFEPSQLDKEPDRVLYKDLYPWDAIEDTPFGASLAIVEPGGQTMKHSHDPDETFIIFQGQGSMTVDEETLEVSQGDVVVMPSGSEHTIKNESDTESLMFLSVFWWPDDTDTHSYTMFTNDDQETETPTPPRLIFPSPPTSNGPLHVGHLSGPYLMADVVRRYDALNRRPGSIFLCLSDDHQSYTKGQAEEEGRPVEEVSSAYSDQIQRCLKKCEAEPDVFVRPSKDPDYRDAVSQAFRQLVDRGLITQTNTSVFYCPSCDRSLYDGQVVGGCPHCPESSMGFCCESCCQPNQTVDLLEPECSDCEGTPEIRQESRWLLDLEPAREALSEYLEHLALSPKLRMLGSLYLSSEKLLVPASAPSDWGISVPGDESQVISPWIEIALANHYLRQEAGEHGEVLHSFGYDNAFCYLMVDPAISLMLDPKIPLANELVANEYLSLNDAKMSTSKGHYLSPDQLLTRMPIDLLRFYLALVRPESAESSVSLGHMGHTLNTLLIGRWQDWLAEVGASVNEEFMSAAPEPQEWAPEHQAFMAELSNLSHRARRAYEMRRLQTVAQIALDLVETSIRFGHEQSHLQGLEGYEEQRATGLALSLAAARLLAIMVQPIMPNFGAQLWKILGNHHSMTDEGWSSDLKFLPPGQRILARAGLCGRRLFPPSVDLSELIEDEQ